MTADGLAQAVLPWILAAVMLAMGLSLAADNFRRVARHPGRLALGLARQMLVLPRLSWAAVLLLPLPLPPACCRWRWFPAAPCPTCSATWPGAMMVAFAVLEKSVRGIGRPCAVYR